jgi:ketosteroid isomerase-like protein
MIMHDNARLARQLMECFGKDMPFWWANADEGLVLDFPFARLIGMPERIEGLAASKLYLDNVVASIKGLTFRDLVVMPLADPDTVLLEYKGRCAAPNGTYDQRYITVMQFSDGRLSLFREYWDSSEVTRAFGNLADAFA